MFDAAFRPVGPTYFVDESAAVQALCVPVTTAHQQYRIRSLTVGAGLTSGYLAYSTANISGGGTPTMVKPVAPTGGTPSGSNAQNTIGMFSGSVEVFTLPAGAWFIASAGATFEVEPGDGV